MTVTPATLSAACDHLRSVDPAFGPIIDAAGPCTLGLARSEVLTHPDQDPAGAHFAALVGDIIAQQLSTKVARTLTERFRAALDGDVSPSKVLALDVEGLRSTGVSGAKARTIRGLAAAVAGGELDLVAMAHDPDGDRVRRDLTALWGIGRWTAEMFEMFTLHRLDVWPVGDLGLRRGWAVLHADSHAADAADGQADPLQEGTSGARGGCTVAEPSPALLEELGTQLRPYRSVAAWYCWRALDTPLI